MDKLVPFGKYKGQPVEVLAEDRQYTDWLMAQDWFRARHTEIYQVIVNNFAEPSETPEHNALQARFLDAGFCRQFVVLVAGDALRRAVREYEARTHDKFLETMARARDGRFSHYWKEYVLPEIYCKGQRIEQSLIPDVLVIGPPQFEVSEGGSLRSADVVFRANASVTMKVYKNAQLERLMDWGLEQVNGVYTDRYAIEVKPAVGDDYPAVLRAMKVSGCHWLVVQTYTGTGVTREQFAEIFRLSGKRVVFVDEIEATPEQLFPFRVPAALAEALGLA